MVIRISGSLVYGSLHTHEESARCFELIIALPKLGLNLSIGYLRTCNARDVADFLEHIPKKFNKSQ
jgi:hypothetical protein